MCAGPGSSQEVGLVDLSFVGSFSVIGLVKPASHGQVKTGHFEEATVRRIASPVKGESSGESTQDGQSPDNSDVALARLVLQADWPGAGG